MKADVIALIGNKGAGKDTVAKMIEANAKSYDHVVILSFGDALKDATSAIFGFSREMIEGSTKESRKWRETEIPYLSERMHHKVTPRYLLQILGTDILRKYLYNDVWVDSVLNKMQFLIQKEPNKDFLFVITDCRFKNEIAALANYCPGVRFVEIDRRFRNTDAYHWAYIFNTTHNPIKKAWAFYKLRNTHRSDWDWVGVVKDPVLIYNIGNLDNLESLVNSVIL